MDGLLNVNKGGFYGLIAILLFSVSLDAQEVRRISHKNVSVEIVIDKPKDESVDVVVAFAGTVMREDRVLDAAKNILARVRKLTDRKDVMIVSVAYPQDEQLFGENIRHADAALIWVKEKSGRELGKKIGKIFLIGHSQGGYIVTRLNTMHETDGVIANAPGPLNLVLRCGLDEKNRAARSKVCSLLNKTYGDTTANPTAYMERSLLNFTHGFKADILFVQGMQDQPVQMASWPKFKEKVNECKTCKKRQFIEIVGGGHASLFDSPEARKAYNEMIKR